MPRTSVRSEANGSPKLVPPPIAARMDESEYENVSIWQAMEKMTPDDWSDKLLYVYRLKPMSVNKLTGDHNYIDKRIESIDQEQLRAMYGGGTFQLILNKTNPTRTLIKAQVKIPGDPIIREDETLVTPPDNKGVQASGAAAIMSGASVDDTIKLLSAVKEIATKEGRPPEATAAALSQALQLVADGARKGMEITAVQAANSGVSIEKLLELALKAREPKEDPMLKNLIEPVIRRALEPVLPPKEKSVREWVEEVRALEELLGTGARRSSGGDGLWGVLAQGFSKLADCAPDLVRALRESRMGPMLRPNAGPYYPGAPQPGMMPQPVLAAMPQPGGPGPAPAGSMGPMGPMGPMGQAAIDPQFVVKTRIVRAFVDGDNGEFIGWYLQKEAPGIYGALKGKNLEEVKTFLAGDPILKELLGQDGVDEFVGQVLSYVNDEQPAETVQ